MGNFFKYLLILGPIFLAGAAFAMADEPTSKSSDPSIEIEDVGTLALEKASKGSGAIATFTPIRIKTRYCSGACDGVSVGSWTCPDDKNCFLNCTTNPPTTGCY